MFFFFKRYGDHRDLHVLTHSFPTRRSSDLFRWNQLLSFDACVQCGKCEAACPAFAAGQPLNPKKLVQDMVVGMSGATDAKYAGSPYPGKPVGQHPGPPDSFIFSDLLAPDTLWSCTDRKSTRLNSYH